LIDVRATEDKTRENIVLAMQRKEKRNAIAMWLNVSLNTIDKVWHKFKKQAPTNPYPTQDVEILS